MSHTAYVGLGSNLEGPERQVAQALTALARLGRVRASALYRTEPLGGRPDPWYVNAVAELVTDLAPEGLLRALQRLERGAGRPADRPRWASRVLDLDLLLYDERVLETDALSLPHRELCRRRFVLEPLLELAPGLRDPRTGTALAEILAALDDPLMVEKLPPEWGGTGARRSEAVAPEPRRRSPA